ncbi:MAG: hypothetical protein IKJ51_01730 [Clostridia bacterium]|nr:hypothetical protein [Clostridia bacterium]MBR6809752.1 hypothetical protein [Clostridia bacterium]
MNKRAFRLSPGAPSLVLIVVVLSMSIMGMLMFIRTQNDMRLSSRSVQVAGQDARLYVQAEETFAALDGMVLQCRLKAAGDEQLLELVAEALPEDMEMEGNVIFWQETDGGRIFWAGAQVQPVDSETRLTWHTRTLEAEVGETWNIF